MWSLLPLNTLSCPLHNSSCMHLSWLTGPPSMLQGLCVLSAPQAHPLCHKSFVCWRGLYDDPLSALWAHPLLCRSSMGLSGFWAHHLISPQSVSCSWAEKCSFLYFLASESLFGPVFQDTWSSTLVSPVKELPSAQGILLFQGLVSSSGHKKLPSKEFSVFSLSMSPSSLLPHFEAYLSPWRFGVFCWNLEVAL